MYHGKSACGRLGAMVMIQDLKQQGIGFDFYANAIDIRQKGHPELRLLHARLQKSVVARLAIGCLLAFIGISRC